MNRQYIGFRRQLMQGTLLLKRIWLSAILMAMVSKKTLKRQYIGGRRQLMQGTLLLKRIWLSAI